MKLFLLCLIYEKQKTNNEIKIRTNKKDKINKPLSGSFAKVWTEFKIPDRTKKCPHILNVNVVIDRIITHDLELIFFPKLKHSATMWLVLTMALKKHSLLDPKTKIHPILIRNMPKLILARYPMLRISKILIPTV